MKINLDIVLSENRIGRDYRKLVMSLIKHILTDYRNGEFFNQFYGANDNYKDFAWSIKFIEPDFKSSKAHIKLGSPEIKVSILVSDLKDAIVFYNACVSFKGQNYKYKEKEELRLDRVTFEKDRKVTMPTVLLKVLSPLCLRDHDRDTNRDRYICCEDDDFISELIKNLKNNYSSAYKKSIEELKIDKSALKKTVVDLFGNKIQVSVGYLILQGDVKLLNKILSKGLGSRRGNGFGVLELTEETEVTL